MTHDHFLRHEYLKVLELENEVKQRLLVLKRAGLREYLEENDRLLQVITLGGVYDYDEIMKQHKLEDK